MLLWRSRGEGGEVGHQGGVALQAAQDLLLAEAFRDAAVDAGAGALVVAHAAERDGVQGVVGAAVAAAVEAVAAHRPELAGMGAAPQR